MAQVTLKEIEQEVARRIGPTGIYTVASGDVNTLVINRLKNSIDADPKDDFWILRRGKKIDGSMVAGYVADDRVRRVSVHTISTGTIQPDRLYTSAVVANEEVELVSVDPDDMRKACQAGLRKCYIYRDISEVTLTSSNADQDISTLVPWVKNVTDIYDIESGSSVSSQLSSPTNWWEPYMKLGVVWVRMSATPYPNKLLLVSRRPASTLVNGVTSTTGPTADDDYMNVDIDYAASAAHTECWRFFPELLEDLAATGKRLTKEGAAVEFTQIAARRYVAPPDRIIFSRPLFGSRGIAL